MVARWVGKVEEGSRAEGKKEGVRSRRQERRKKRTDGVADVASLDGVVPGAVGED